LSVLTYPVAVAAAALFAVAIPLEHRAADRAPDAAGLGPRQIGAFVRATVQNRWWLAGMSLNALGFGLHATALHLGSLAVVQPLLVTNLLFALPINHWLRREPIKPVELAWAGILVVGLSGFLLLATAGVRNVSQAADRGPAVAAGALVIVVAGALVVTARRSGRSTAATLLGVATGVLFAVTASLIKESTGVLAKGPLALVFSWQLYALLLAGATGLLLNQLAYQAGPLSASLPAIAVVDPLVAVLLGIAVFDENLRHSLPAILGEVVFLALLAVGAFNLARLERQPTAGRTNTVGVPGEAE
jgi:drug/metabolite transporter (DMT)-like permease